MKRIALFVVALVVVAFSPVLLAQEASAPAGTDLVPTNWLAAIIPAIVPVIIIGVKALLPRLPKAWLPILAVALGAGLSLIEHFTTGSAGTAAGSGVLGAILGAAGVGLREIIDQIGKARTQPEA